MSDPVTTKRTRSREYSFGSRRSFGALRANNVIQSIYLDATIPVTAVGKQVTVSEGHLFPYRRKLGELRKWDVGGPFLSTETYVADSDGRRLRPNQPGTQSEGGYRFTSRDNGKGAFQGNYEYYRGPILPVDPTSTLLYPGVSPSSDAEMDAFGAVAIAQCNPLKPAADAATFLGELYREGIPSFLGVSTWRDRANYARGAGSEYLNAQFGWAPLLRDVTKIATSVGHAHDILRQYERNSGKDVRRQFHFNTIEDVVSTVEATGVAPYGPEGAYFVSTVGTLRKERRTVVKRWFSGCFTYYLPRGETYRGKQITLAAQAHKLLGISLTPDVLWNLAPWSWAADWFSNAGEVINNLNLYATQGLIMRYGYMMETKTVTDTYTHTGSTLRIAGGSPVPITPSLSFVTVTKKRRKANPFGFGVSWDGLSPFQLSIIAALGMSRSSGRRLSD